MSKNTNIVTIVVVGIAAYIGYLYFSGKSSSTIGQNAAQNIAGNIGNSLGSFLFTLPPSLSQGFIQGTQQTVSDLTIRPNDLFNPQITNTSVPPGITGATSIILDSSGNINRVIQGDRP